MKHLIFLLALPLFAQQQTFKKVTINQTGGGVGLALSGGSVTMGGTTVLDTSRNGTFVNVTGTGTAGFSGTITSTAGNVTSTSSGSAGFVATAGAFGSATVDLKSNSATQRWIAKSDGGSGNFVVRDETATTDYFTITKATGAVTIPGALTVGSCTGCSSGVTSVSGTSPIASSGGATPAISCSTCITTAGGQSIAGTTTVSTLAATSAITLATTGNAIFQATGGALGDAYLYLRPNSAGYLWDIRAKGTSDVLQFNHSGTTLLSMNSSGGLTMASGGSSQIYVGTSGNLYLRTFSGTPNCSGVTDGWIGYDTGGDHLYICSGGTLYAH